MNTPNTPSVFSRWLCLGTLVFALAHLSHAAQDYYVDAAGGNDLNAGTSSGAAWQTLNRVNTGPAATGGVYQPGDRILFKSGGVWSGSLYPRGSGNSANYIRIGKYGGAVRPIINGGGAVPSRDGIDRLESATVWLYNQKYWEVKNLEITNYVSASASDVLNPAVSSDGYRWGILVEAQYGQNGDTVAGTSVKEYPGFRILDNVIHHVEGYDSAWANAGNGTQKQKSTGGIHFNIRRVTPYEPMDDAYGHDGSHASEVHGSENYLEVKGSVASSFNRKAVIKFSVPDITNTITNAKLRFRARNIEDTSTITLKVYSTADASDGWNEDTVTWNTLPATVTQLNTVNIVGSADADYEVDVTSYVQAQAGTSGDKTISFLVGSTMSSAAARTVRIHSKEAGGGNAPKLEVSCGDTTPGRFRDVLVEGNYIHSLGACAISTRSGWSSQALKLSDPAYVVWYDQADYTPWPGVVIRDNFIEDIARDGMIIRVTSNALVEHNVIDYANNRSGSHGVGMFAFNAEGTVFQYNEVSNTQTPTGVDGVAYDIDYLQRGTIIQYNYSHNNVGGFMISTADSQIGYTSSNSVVRYNVSENDYSRIYRFSGGSDNIQIYNNTAYVGSAFGAGKIVDVSNWGGSWPKNARFTNNITYNNSSSASYNFGSATGFTFDRCLFYNTGAVPSGEPSGTTSNYTVTNKLTSNPNLVSVNSGGDGWETVSGYRLSATSPGLGGGAVITTTNATLMPLPTIDYWGNPVSGSVAPNIGFYNGYGVDASSTLYFIPEADTYTYDAAPGTNNGASTILQVKGPASGVRRKAFLRFNLSSIDSASAATLNLHGKNVQDSSSAAVTAYQVTTDTWTEALTWNSSPQPSVGSAINSVTVGGSGTNPVPYYPIDVTSFVQNEIAGDNLASFLVDSTADKLFQFDSKDATSGFPMLDLSGTITITADQDTHVRDGAHGSTSYGTSTTIEVKDGLDADYSRKAYIRFPLPSTLVGVNSAKLRMYGNASGGSSLVKVFRVTDDSWTNSLTWNASQPATTTIVTAKLVGTTAQYYEFDVTDWVQNRLGSGFVSMLLIATDSSDVQVTFNSQDNASNKPQLVLQ